MLKCRLRERGKLEQCRVGVFKLWSCDCLIFFCGGRIQADGYTVDHLCEFRDDIAPVIQIAKSVCVQADGDRVSLFYISSAL